MKVVGDKKRARGPARTGLCSTGLHKNDTAYCAKTRERVADPRERLKAHQGSDKTGNQRSGGDVEKKVKRNESVGTDGGKEPMGRQTSKMKGNGSQKRPLEKPGKKE